MKVVFTRKEGMVHILTIISSSVIDDVMIGWILDITVYLRDENLGEVMVEIKIDE